MIPFTPEWRAARARQQQARRYVGAAGLAEPIADDVGWLAAAAAFGDDDHARWELRYARMAIAALVAQRDALDDRTGSEVMAALHAALAHDERIAPDLQPLAERQLSDRLVAYREALNARGGGGAGAPPLSHLGRVLLSFASDGARSAGTPLQRATEILQRYEEAAGATLREVYGVASLPEHLPPSEVAGKP